jgi:hypothetical protein
MWSSLGKKYSLFPYLFILGSFFLAGCTSSPSAPVDTPLPDEHIPTIIAQTAAASGMLPPTEAHDNTPLGGTTEGVEVETQDAPELAATETIGEPPSAIEAVEGTPPPIVPEMIEEGFTPPIIPIDIDFPPAIIKIYRPGDLSRLISPFRVVANVPPGQNGQVQVELVGEDGRTLVRLLKEVSPLPGASTANLVVEMTFETPAVAEAGRLQVTVKDDFGRPISVNSVNLIMLSTGYSELKGYGDLRENIIIQQPAAGSSTTSGGTLFVSGVARTGDDKPLVVELIDQNGRVVGYGTAQLLEPAGRGYVNFLGEIKYSVTGLTDIRLIVRARGARIPGTAYLSSVEVILNP